MRHVLGKSLAAAVILTLAVAAPASAATLADWEMNEPSGATTMIDSSGHVNGTIGSAVKTGVSVMGATVSGETRAPGLPGASAPSARARAKAS